MFRHYLKTLLVATLSTALWGCQLLETTPIVENNRLNAPNNQSQLQHLSNWTILGKIGITQGSKRDTAAINYWHQKGDHYDIQVSSTLLGLGATVIQGDPDYLTIEAAGEEPVSSSNPQQLLIESVGWQLPLGAMPYWVKGIPSPDSPYTWQQEHQSQELLLLQSDWTIRYDRLEPLSTEPEAPYLPRKIVMTQGNKEIKIVVNEWIAE